MAWSICLFIFAFLVAGAIILYDIHDKVEPIGIIIPTALFFSIIFISALCFSCRYHYTTITLGPNSITVDQKAVFRKRTVIFNPGDLERAQLLSSKEINNNNGETFYIYQLYLMPKKGKKIEIYHLVRTDDFRMNEFRGIKYFIDSLNFHINNNMKV